MRDPFANYDNWLIGPMERAEAEAEHFIDWCETHNIDPEDPDAETMYNDYIDSQWEPPDGDYDEREDYVYDEY